MIKLHKFNARPSAPGCRDRPSAPACCLQASPLVLGMIIPGDFGHVSSASIEKISRNAGNIIYEIACKCRFGGAMRQLAKD
jgi:hypothetical protein